jgi:hypothetical protein
MNVFHYIGAHTFNQTERLPGRGSKTPDAAVTVTFRLSPPSSSVSPRNIRETSRNLGALRHE